MPNYTHVMLDLETLSTRVRAAVLQIAALAFDPETGERDDAHAFNVYVSEWGGAHVEPRTVLWWMQQAHAPVIAAKCEEHGVDLGAALIALQDWFAMQTFELPGGKVMSSIEAVWCHGLTFDVPILAEAYESRGMRVPWHYRTPRDTRTLYALAPGGCPQVAVDPTLKHDALEDCKVQIAQVCGALAAIRRCVQITADVDFAESPLSDEVQCYDPPPVWSKAEGYAEALANPTTEALANPAQLDFKF